MRGICAPIFGLVFGALTIVAAEPAPNSSRLERAIALLDAPAASAEGVRQARAELAVLADDARHPNEASVALYLLGRLEQLTERTIEPAAFQRLRAEHGDHPLAQLAALKVLLHRLYAEGPEAADARLAHGEALAPTFTVPALRCDYHLAMGEAYIFHGDRTAPALRHLRAAAALGVPSAAARANVLVQIGELARLTGDRAVAAASYRAFLGEFPRDLRQQIVRDHLAEVEGKTP